MPELPEIETVKLQLQKVLPGKTIEKVEVLSYAVFQGKKELIEGKKVVGVERRAKVLLIDLDPPAQRISSMKASDGQGVSIAIHFKMTGQLIYDRNPTSPSVSLGVGRIAGGHPTEDFVAAMPSKHTRVIFHLDEGDLYFNDQRLFGWVKTGTKEEIANMKFLLELGPEPFDIDVQKFTELVAKRKKPVKLVLMDQTVISGVGNIYANDACWEAKVNPRRLANTLTTKQYTDLYTGLVKVLKEGIAYGGATAADAKYIDLHGLGGHYQEHFRTYDREGEECLRQDGGIIHKFTLGGRGTYVCPKCQE